MLLLAPILLPLGLFVPGYLIARWLGEKLWAPAAFVLSLPVLFYCVFWLGVFGAGIDLWTVVGLLAAASAIGLWLSRKAAAPKRPKKEPWSKLEKALLWSYVAIGVLLLVRSFRAPFAGPDSWFRWDYLARRIYDLHRFDFYPPLHPADFKIYFYVDAIPPMIAFEHWWLYAAAGGEGFRLICVLVAAEFAATLSFVYATAATLSSRRAGILAAALLASSAIYFVSLFFAQETGLTALAVAAMLYFIVSAEPRREVPAMICAGIAAALCALAREYGWAAVAAGVVALAWRRTSLRNIAIFTGVAAAVGAPWYIRNWILAGNPLYSLAILGFAVNPVHAAIIQSYKGLWLSQLTSAGKMQVLISILAGATLPLFAGIPGACLQFRRHGYLLVTAALFIVAWYASIPYTSAGAELSLRVLPPALVALSIAGAAALDRWIAGGHWRTAAPVLLGLCLLWSAIYGAFYPLNPLNLKPEQWLAAAVPRLEPPVEFRIRDDLGRAFPSGYRILSDNAYLHAALYDLGIEVVPVWSPEVRFLFSDTPEEADRKLTALHIISVAWYPRSWNTPYLRKASPFLGSNRWKVVTGVGSMLILAPPSLVPQ